MWTMTTVDEIKYQGLTLVPLQHKKRHSALHAGQGVNDIIVWIRQSPCSRGGETKKSIALLSTEATKQGLHLWDLLRQWLGVCCESDISIRYGLKLSCNVIVAKWFSNEISSYAAPNKSSDVFSPWWCKGPVVHVAQAQLWNVGCPLCRSLGNSW